MLRPKYDVEKGARAVCADLIWPILLQDKDSPYYSDFLQGGQTRRNATGYCRQLGALTMDQRDMIRSIVRETVFAPQYADDWRHIKQKIGGANAAFDLTYIVLPYIVILKMLEKWGIGGMTAAQAEAFLQVTSDETLQVFQSTATMDLSEDETNSGTHANEEIPNDSNKDDNWSDCSNIKIILLP